MTMVNFQAPAVPHATHDAPRPSLASRLRKRVLLLLRLRDRQSQRRALLELEDHFLSDIGVSRRQALEEGRKPFWR
jgi:uncharacterized protein YjiS (DUF1127 family)